MAEEKIHQIKEVNFSSVNGSNSYDALVIGSGISGGWAAKEFCEKGIKTLILERGRNVEHIKDYSRNRGFNESRLDHGRKTGKTYRFSETTFTSSGKQHRANLNSDQRLGSNEKGTKENSSGLDINISHHSSSTLSSSNGLSALFDIPTITPASDNHTKKQEKTKYWSKSLNSNFDKQKLDIMLSVFQE